MQLIKLLEKYETQCKLLTYPCYIPTNRVRQNQCRWPLMIPILLTHRVKRETIMSSKRPH